MSLHDEYARLTPFELAFDDRDGAAALAEAVRTEADARGVDALALEGFLTLGAVDAYVRRVAGEEVDATALHRFGPLAWHAVRFAEAGRPLYLMTTHAARYLVEGVPGDDPTPPEPAGYVQLPQHLFWTRPSTEAPESVDGLFWSVNAGVLRTLVVTGLRPDRPGLGVVSLPAAPLADAVGWLGLETRADGEDFSTDLPGAELDALYEMRATGEPLKLLARFFAHLRATPEAVAPGEPAEPVRSPPGMTGEAPGAPRPSALAFRRVGLGAVDAAGGTAREDREEDDDDAA